jgi:hypothetical protein
MQLEVEEEGSVVHPAEIVQVSGTPGDAKGRQGVEQEHRVGA